jgi:hypothetical protein
LAWTTTDEEIMKTKQVRLSATHFSSSQLQPLQAINPQLMLVFAGLDYFRDPAFFRELMSEFPGVRWAGCSTAGEISLDGVTDGSAILTAVAFEHPDFRVVTAPLSGLSGSRDAGVSLSEQLAADNLHAVLLFGQGVDINGSALIEGVRSGIGADVMVSGGLAGDAGQFSRSYVLSDAGVSESDVVAVGFYGNHIEFSHGSFGGWQPFGPARKVTHSEGSILYELDGEPALDIYKRYLGDHAKGLPASGLLFPFSMMSAGREEVGIIRTILGVDETAGSLILAGDILEGGYLQLMHASPDALVDGAQSAAEAARHVATQSGGLALLVSCIGRKLVLGGRVDEEVEAVGEVFGQHVALTGFYSNGEISPFLGTTDCKLHNQTMTITCLGEK